MLKLFAVDAERIHQLGKSAGTPLRVHTLLQRRLTTTAARAATALGLSFPANSGALDRLVELGIVRELAGAKTNRVFAYKEYLAILRKGTEPL